MKIIEKLKTAFDYNPASCCGTPMKVTLLYDGRTIRFNCLICLKTFLERVEK